MAHWTQPPVILTPEQQAEICLLYKEGTPTKELAHRYGVGERTIQRVHKGEYRKHPVVKGRLLTELDVKLEKPSTKVAVRPQGPQIPSRCSAFVPCMKDLNSVHLPNGAVMMFREDGTLARVERCPIYNGRHISWRTATVEVQRIVGNFICAIIRQWSGEEITGFLVFDGNKAGGIVRNCGFFYDRLPEKVAREAEQVRNDLAAVTGVAKLQAPKKTQRTSSRDEKHLADASKR